MNGQNKRIFAILLGTTLAWTTLAPHDAAAQWGGRPSGKIFTPPKDARTAQTARRAGDPYDPREYLAQRGTPRRGRSRRAQHSVLVPSPPNPFGDDPQTESQPPVGRAPQRANPRYAPRQGSYEGPHVARPRRAPHATEEMIADGQYETSEGEYVVGDGVPVDEPYIDSHGGPYEGSYPADGVYRDPYVGPYEDPYDPHGGAYRGGPHGGPYDGPYDGHCDSCDGPCDGSHGTPCDCGAFWCDDCTPVWCIPAVQIRHFQIFGGVHGFKGPPDLQGSGYFGFQEGLNIGGPVWLLPPRSVSYQIGFQAVQSALSGTLQGNDREEQESRQQFFMTVGLFHRSLCGLQGGVAFDWVSDSYGQMFEQNKQAYGESGDLQQLRGEISYVGQRKGEFGFTFTVGTGQAVRMNNDNLLLRIEPVDQYLFFYRWQGEISNETRVFAGFSGNTDGILGFDSLIPLSDSFSVVSGVSYLIPNDGGLPSAVEESWNISISLVWNFQRTARNQLCSPYRPLFSVANNGSLFQGVKVLPQANDY